MTMRSISLAALALILGVLATPAWAATPQASVCATPGVVSGASYSVCPKTACGPNAATDLARTADPAHAGGQAWITWSLLADTAPVVNCVTGAWTTKGALGAVIPTPPPPIPPPAFTATVTILWNAPTQNTDGTPLTDLASYNVYMGATVSNLLKVGSVKVGTLDFTTIPLTVGSYYFTVTAVNLAGAESEKSGVVSTVIKKASVIPGPPSIIQAVTN